MKTGAAVKQRGQQVARPHDGKRRPAGNAKRAREASEFALAAASQPLGILAASELEAAASERADTDSGGIQSDGAAEGQAVSPATEADAPGASAGTAAAEPSGPEAVVEAGPVAQNELVAAVEAEPEVPVDTAAVLGEATAIATVNGARRGVVPGPLAQRLRAEAEQR